MDSPIRSTLWSAYGVLVVIIVAGLALTVGILHLSNKQESRIVEGSGPLLDAVSAMNDDTLAIMSAARGFALTKRSQFQQQYDEAVRDFRKSSTNATHLATDPRDAQRVVKMRKLFDEIKLYTDQEMSSAFEGRDGNANEFMVAAAKEHSAAPDYAGTMADEHARTQRSDLQRITGMRSSLTLLMVIVSLVVIAIAAFLIWKIQQSLMASVQRQVQRTETMIAGMSDGVMLVDAEGKTAFLNPAAQRLLNRSEVGVPIFKHAETYGLVNDEGLPIDAKELPAARALSTGRAVRDATMRIASGDRQIAISMSATPLHEDGHISGVIVTFRDITERLRLEESCSFRPSAHRFWPTPARSSPATSIPSG